MVCISVLQSEYVEIDRRCQLFCLHTTTCTHAGFYTQRLGNVLDISIHIQETDWSLTRQHHHKKGKSLNVDAHSRTGLSLAVFLLKGLLYDCTTHLSNRPRGVLIIYHIIISRFDCNRETDTHTDRHPWPLSQEGIRSGSLSAVPRL